MQQHAHLGSTRPVYLPRQLALTGRVCGNVVRQLKTKARNVEAEVRTYKKGRITGSLVILPDSTGVLAVASKVKRPSDTKEVLVIPGCQVPHDELEFATLQGRCRWIDPAPAEIATLTPAD
ncbi:MAG TPA: hypothetical protein PKA95_08815, partial [Thermomicrobiales bacterium]|nr:hypothetical protein [Thermomicrobiales bacterium]